MMRSTRPAPAPIRDTPVHPKSAAGPAVGMASALAGDNNHSFVFRHGGSGIKKTRENEGKP